MGGADHASARYVFTNLSKVTRKLFREEDDHIVEYLEDDG
jgi:DNA topoisomerase-2